ncbi:MAG: DUF4248 domain-containing protein [Prevotella sp.]|nr:DUF4248 domain-containing protein [Prevotella sp.]
MKRRDLAKMYFPEMSDVEAVRSLRRWIEGCPKLMSALEELSMPFKKSRNLSARQVRIIMEYLGDPLNSILPPLEYPVLPPLGYPVLPPLGYPVLMTLEQGVLRTLGYSVLPTLEQGVLMTLKHRLLMN